MARRLVSLLSCLSPLRSQVRFLTPLNEYFRYFSTECKCTKVVLKVYQHLIVSWLLSLFEKIVFFFNTSLCLRHGYIFCLHSVFTFCIFVSLCVHGELITSVDTDATLCFSQRSPLGTRRVTEIDWWWLSLQVLTLHCQKKRN